MKVTKEKIECSMREWDCYSKITPSYLIDIINSKILEILNTTHSPLESQNRIYTYLEQYSGYGFTDSECFQCATDIINSYYNTKINRWAHLTLKKI